MKKNILSDLHIHIGQSQDGRPVKITASAKMTLDEVIRNARDIKGLELISIVDSHSLGVRNDYRELINKGYLKPLGDGGYQAGSLIIIPGMESEIKIGTGQAHLLAYFPSIEETEKVIDVLKPYTRNWQLSTQKIHVDAEFWIETVQRFNGIWMPAHAFTPHKGIYGSCCSRMKDVLLEMPLALEIGLSADRIMASGISEAGNMIMFSNSDAHSLPNIAREYNSLDLTSVTFAGLSDLFKGKGWINKNYGLDPLLGKYHRTYCLDCLRVTDSKPPTTSCNLCGSENVVMGVMDRIVQIADQEIKRDRFYERQYVYQIPLGWLPGIGPKTYHKLLREFGTELAILHKVPKQDIIRLFGEKTGQVIEKARTGQIICYPGGGGIFGKIGLK